MSWLHAVHSNEIRSHPGSRRPIITLYTLTHVPVGASFVATRASRERPVVAVCVQLLAVSLQQEREDAKNALACPERYAPDQCVFFRLKLTAEC